MKIENFIALRYIRESKKNKDISTASIIVILVIAVSIIFFISSVSIMNGYIYGIMKIALEVKSFHIDYPAYYSYKDSKYVLNRIRKNEEIKYAGIYREAKVLLSANTKNSGLIYFRSVPEDIFKKDTAFDNSIRLLDGKKDLGRNKVLISKKSSEKLRLKVGDTVYLTAMMTEDQPKVTLKRLKVSGIFSTGYVELDEQLSYIGRGTGVTVFEDNVGYNIFIKLEDHKRAEQITMSYDLAGLGGMRSWEEANYNELTALRFEKNVIAFIVILVVFVAVLNILTSIYLSVHEKKRDIGLLKAVGYSPGNINIIFLLNGIYLGFVGTILGVVSGLLIMKWLNEILQFFAFFYNKIQIIIYRILSIFVETDIPEKFEIFSKDFYLDKIYTEIAFSEIFMIAALTLLFSIMAAIIPAVKAGNIKPVEVIKNG